MDRQASRLRHVRRRSTLTKEHNGSSIGSSFGCSSWHVCDDLLAHDKGMTVREEREGSVAGWLYKPVMFKGYIRFSGAKWLGKILELNNGTQLSSSHITNIFHARPFVMLSTSTVAIYLILVS